MNGKKTLSRIACEQSFKVRWYLDTPLKTGIIIVVNHMQGQRVLFKNCEILVQELLIAKRDFMLLTLLKKLGRYKALIIDDIGDVR